MNALELEFHRATLDDAEVAAECIRETSEGIVDHLFAGLFPDITTEQILAMILREGNTHFQTNNITLIRHHEQLAGLIFAYPASQHTIPPIMEKFLSPARVEAVREILTTSVTNTLYVNTIWVHPSWRGGGLADVLMNYSEMCARDICLTGISLHTWADNARALAFYKRHGFSQHQTIPACETLIRRHPLGSIIMAKTWLS